MSVNFSMNLATKTVLIVDDFQNMRSTLRQMLVSLGFEQITAVASGEDALAALRMRRFDVIVCDYNLGDGIDGQQLLDQARGERLVDLGTVFVMVTAENSNEMVVGALEFAPDAYVAKPFTKDLLRARLGRALRFRDPLVSVAQALAANGPAAALRALDALLAADPGQRLGLLRIRAELAFDSGDLAGAEATCIEAMVARPVAWALALRGRLAEARNDLALAEALYQESITLTPYFMPAHDWLALLRERQGRDIEALDGLIAAVGRSPKSLSRQRQVARLATRLGRDVQAEPAWRRAIAFATQMGLPAPADHLGLIRALVARGEGREAAQRIKALSRSCAGDPDLPWWEFVARLWCLAPTDEAGKGTLLLELNTLLAGGVVPHPVAAALAEALARLGVLEKYPALAAAREVAA